MIIIILFIILYLIKKSINRYNRIFNPFTLSIQIPLLFLIIPQTLLILFAEGEDYFISDIVILLYVFFIWIGTQFRIPTFNIPDIKNLKILFFFLFLLILTLLIVMTPTIMMYGLSFSGLRSFYEDIVFSPLASIYETFKTVILFLVTLIFIKNKRMTLGLMLLSVLIVFSGSKMAILSTVIILATLYEEFKDINYKRLFFVFMSVFCFMLYYHFIQSGQTEVLKAAFSYFDIYNNQAMAIEMFLNDKLDYFYGEIAGSAYLKSIPRIIWPDKPTDYGFALLNYAIYPEYAASGYMPSFGLAYIFADFGFISIIFSGLFVGFSKNYFYKAFVDSNKNNASYALYLFNFNIVIFLLFSFSYMINTIKK